MTTTRPSGTDASSSSAAITTMATTAPVPRAVMSSAPPTWLMSDVPTLTTSPVASRRGRLAPSRFACATVSWSVRYAADSQLRTVSRCRPMPLAASRRARPTSTPPQASRASPSRAVSPSSIALPITAGTNACATIHTMPSSAAAPIDTQLVRASHTR
jgi:hypothetical protein